ncbi:MAG: carboxypeptidase regulatory-like domain-containing protein [Pyramidobacter sp.]|jgi:hypothetical protein
MKKISLCAVAVAMLLASASFVPEFFLPGVAPLAAEAKNRGGRGYSRPNRNRYVKRMQRRYRSDVKRFKRIFPTAKASNKALQAKPRVLPAKPLKNVKPGIFARVQNKYKAVKKVVEQRYLPPGSKRRQKIDAKLKTGTDVVVGLYQGYISVMAGKEYMDREFAEALEKNPDMEMDWWIAGKGAMVGVGTFLGIQGVFDNTLQNYKEDLEKYYRDRAEGKEWRMSPEEWAIASLAWEGSKAIAAMYIGDLMSIGEAAWEGGGTLKAYAQASAAARSVLETDEVLKEKYKPLSDLISKAIGAPLPPLWERERHKYWRIFRPVLEDPEMMTALMQGLNAADLKNWLQKYKDLRVKELGVAFGTPGADNPDDNENIGAALLSFSAQERPLWLCALSQGDEFTMDWLKGRDREAWGGELSAETLGAFLDAALDSSPIKRTAKIPDEQKEALDDLCRDVAWNAALTPDVAILSSGYARGAAALLDGQAAVMVRPDADPELLANYPLLIVPSGALSDYASSARFRGAMERYLESGGTVLVFSQQLGRDYRAIPGGVTAYGFAEDQSCQYASSRIVTANGAFASMTKAAPDFNVDGYFVDWPKDGEVWLSRTKNDQPCMISYPWKNGRVVLSTLYMDWAAGNHQGTADERLFCRDLVAYLLNGDVPFVAKGSAVKICASAQAPTNGVAVTPPEDVQWQSFVPLVLAPDGRPIEAKFQAGEWNVPEVSQSGFYSVGADFLDGAGTIVAQTAPTAAFAVSVLPDDAAAPPADRLPFTLALTSDLENYVLGAQGNFAAHFSERTGQAQDLKVQWRFIHNGWAAKGEDKKLYSGADSVHLPAGGEFTLEKAITVVNTDGIDRFYVDVFDAASGAKMAAMNKGFYTRAPRANVTVTLDKNSCNSGETLLADMTCENPFKTPCGGTARFAVMDGAGKTVLTEEKAFNAEAESATASAQLKLPDEMLSGPCSVQVSAVFRGSMVGTGSAPFNFLGTPQKFKGLLADKITKKPISGGTVSFHLGEAHFEATSDSDGGFALDIPAGSFTLQAGAAEYNGFDGSVLLAPENQPLTVELLPAGSGTGVGTAFGRVADRIDGTPLPDMELNLKRGNETYSLRSDAAGNWAASLLPGDYEVRCPVGGIVPDTNRFAIHVEEGLKLKQDLYLAVGKLRFKVYDAVTGKEAENVQAAIRTDDGWTRDVSPSLNRERIERLKPGRGRIRLTASGYETLETDFFAGERVSDFTAYLRPTTCDAAFEILDLVTEEPVEGARVALDGANAPTGTIDGKGTVVIGGAEAGRRKIVVEAPGYRKLETEGAFAAAAGEAPVRRLYLTPDRDAVPGEARFVVRNLISDEPLEGVVISWEKGKTVTDASGTASMALPDGRRKLKFSREGFAALETDCLMNAVNAEAETYWLAPLTTNRTLVLRNLITGAPVKGVKVLLDGAELGTTAKDGTLAATTPVGRVKFAFEHKSFEPLQTELFFNACAQQTSLKEEIFLKPKLGGFAYTALVRDPSGAPLKGVDVTLKANGTEYKAQTDAKGTFAFRLPMGAFDLKLSRAGSHPLETRGYSGGGSRKGIVEDYVLYPADAPLPEGKGTIRFEVVDAVTGKTVAPLRADIDGQLRICEGTFESETRSGNRDVSFSAAGYEDSPRYATAFFPGQRVTRRVHLWPKEGEIEFDVFDAITGEPLKRFVGRAMGGSQSSFAGGRVVRSAKESGRSNFRADDYAETGDFYPIVFPGRRVTRAVALWPSVGTVEFKVSDALSGAPLEKFVGYALGGRTGAFTEGIAAVHASAGDKRSAFWADGHAETGDFYPTAFPGRKALRNVRLWPSVGTVEFNVSDAVSGKPLENFTGFTLDGPPRAFEKGTAVGHAPAGGRRTKFWANGYFESNDFYPTVFPGRTVACPVGLMPSQGTMEFHPMDALSGEALHSFVASPLDLGGRPFVEPAKLPARAWKSLRTWFAAPGYRDVDNYYPTAYGGRSVVSRLFMTPKAPEAQLTLRAFDVVTGRAVRGATFRVDGQDVAAPAGQAVWRGAADFKGLNVRVRAPGYRESSMPAYLTAGRRDLSVSVPMTPVMPKGDGAVLVTVTDGEGNPLQGATVTLPSEKSAVTAVTDEKGRAFFTGVHAGVPALSATKNGFAGASFRAAVGGGRTFKTKVALTPLSALKKPAPFAPVITAVPEGTVLHPGERTELKFTVENRGGVGGSAFCSVNIPDVRCGGVDLELAPGESKEAALPVEVPQDAATSRILVTAKAEKTERSFMVEIRSPAFSLTAKSDKAAYAEGDAMSVTLTAEAEKGTPDGDYLFRVTFNGESRTQEARLSDGKAEATFSDIPVAFKGNKLLYALYHTDGRSVVIDAMPVLNEDDEILIIPDKPRYRAGEAAKILLRSAEEKELALTSPLFGGNSLKNEEKLVILSETSDETEFQFRIPEQIPTGTYEIHCGDFSAPIGVRGFETTIIDRRLYESGDGETAALTLSWRASTSGTIPCRWTLTAQNPLGGAPEEIASGNLTLEGPWAEYSVPAAVPAAEPRDLELKLVPRGLDAPVAVLRYLWDGRN